MIQAVAFLAMGAFLFVGINMALAQIQATFENTTDSSVEIGSVEVNSVEVEAESDTKADLSVKELPQTTGIEHEDIGAPSTESQDKNHKGEIDILSTSVQAGGTSMTKSDLVAEYEARGAVFVKIGDIKGGSDDSEAKKPKEIVVVGSKVRESSNLDIAQKTHIPDSFFDIEVIISEEDAQLHAIQVAQHDEQIEEVTFTFEKIQFDYETQVQLFGIIPVRATQKTSVEIDGDEFGRVKVRMPWWSAFGRKVVRPVDLEAAVEAEVSQYNESDLTFLQRRAQTLQTLSNVSKALHDTAMNSIRNSG